MNKEIRLSDELQKLGAVIQKPTPKDLVPVSAEEAKRRAFEGSHLKVRNSTPLFDQDNPQG